MGDTGFAAPVDKRHRRAGLCGFDDQGRLIELSGTPGLHALRERPDDLTFESGGQGLWSTLADHLAFARMLIDARAASLLRPDTRVLMTANQLTPAQRASARLLGRSLFAASHGYGMGVAVVLEPEKADPLCCRGGIGLGAWAAIAAFHEVATRQPRPAAEQDARA